MSQPQSWIGDLAGFVQHPAAFALAAAICAGLAVVILLTTRSKRETDVFKLLAQTSPAAPGSILMHAKARFRLWLGNWRRKRRRGLHPVAIPLLAALCGCAFVAFLWLISPFAPRSPMQAYPVNCAQARAMGFANAQRGWPGYFAHLDADGDGVSCEPLPGSGRRW
jgi:hypothetical protein